jgi:hypothetical protein
MCEFLHEYDESKMPECYFYATYGMVHHRLYNKRSVAGEGRWRVRLFCIERASVAAARIGWYRSLLIVVAHAGLGGHELKRATLHLVRQACHCHMKQDISIAFSNA